MKFSQILDDIENNFPIVVPEQAFQKPTLKRSHEYIQEEQPFLSQQQIEARLKEIENAPAPEIMLEEESNKTPRKKRN